MKMMYQNTFTLKLKETFDSLRKYNLNITVKNEKLQKHCEKYFEVKRCYNKKKKLEKIIEKKIS